MSDLHTNELRLLPIPPKVDFTNKSFCYILWPIPNRRPHTVVTIGRYKEIRGPAEPKLVTNTDYLVPCEDRYYPSTAKEIFDISFIARISESSPAFIMEKVLEVLEDQKPDVILADWGSGYLMNPILADNGNNVNAIMYTNIDNYVDIPIKSDGDLSGDSIKMNRKDALKFLLAVVEGGGLSYSSEWPFDVEDLIHYIRHGKDSVEDGPIMDIALALATPLTLFSYLTGKLRGYSDYKKELI